MGTQKIVKAAVLDGVILGLEQALLYITTLPLAHALLVLQDAVAKKKAEAKELEEEKS